MEDEAPESSLTRYLETTRGVLSYAKVADLVADELLELLEEIADGTYEDHPLDGDLLQTFHSRILVKIVPKIAGKWRQVDVAVGKHVPPRAYEVPLRMVEFSRDLEAQITWCADDLDKQIEVLAYAEGQILHVHPFEDFNGRATRAFLMALLQRLDLPPIELSVVRDTPHFDEYTQSLRAFDGGDRSPLRDFWTDRFSAWDPGDDSV